MTKTNNIITINNKHYDAITGKPIASSAPSVIHPKTIDGVVRGNHPAAQPIKSAPISIKQSTPKPRSVAKHATLNKVHASKTLMRQAVKKPTKPLHISGLKAQTPTDLVTVQTLDVAVAPKLSFGVVDSRRETRAKRVAKSKLITRFGEVDMPSSVHLAPAVIPVVSPPVTSPAVAPAKTQKPSKQRSMDIFEKAMLKANGHEQTPPSRKAHATKHRKPRTHRLASVSSAALAVLIIGGFLAYQNVANVTVRMASAKAGFTASLPDHKPAGFSVGKFAYSPGNVTVNFHSNSDDRHFALVEQPSNWDSEALLNDYVATAADQYQTVQTAGRTLYIYGQNSATWVNGGVWYRVDGNNSLSTTQLVNLASSM